MSNELQPKEAVASVTRIPAPDVADKGAASTRLWDLDQPLLHGMELTAASNVARPAVGSSPGGRCWCGHSPESHFIGSTTIKGPCCVCSCIEFSDNGDGK